MTADWPGSKGTKVAQAGISRVIQFQDSNPFYSHSIVQLAKLHDLKAEISKLVPSVEKIQVGLSRPHSSSK